jgi:hypothetical protein
MHRSGTSALTGVLSRCGFAAGKQLMPANEFNAHGYYEDVRLNICLDGLLNGMGRRWYDERALPATWLGSDAATRATNELAEVMRSEFDFSQPVVLKDPRLCRLLPVLQSVWQAGGLSPKYVFSLRSPLAVISSLVRRDALPTKRAALLYVAHMLEAELETRHSPRVFVEYNDLLQGWQGVVSHIASTLNIDALQAAQANPSLVADMDAFLSSDFNHFDAEQTAPKGAPIDMAVQVYELLRGPLDEKGLAALDALRLQWLTYLEFLEPWLSNAFDSNHLRAELSIALFKPNQDMVNLASENATSDIYWSFAHEGYAELRKTSVKWRYGQKTEARFVLPKLTGPVHTLRWDISDRPALCVIDKVWLEDDAGQTQWVWDTREELFGKGSPDMQVLGLSDTEQLWVMATGFDPHAPLNIPPSILSQVQNGWVLCAHWQADLPTCQLKALSSQVAFGNQSRLNAEHALSQTQRESDALRQDLDAKSADLKSLQQQQKLVVEEMVKAEAQLELLKELWIGSRQKKLAS